MTIKDEAAAFVDRDKTIKIIQSIETLPESVKQKISDRDTMRSEHAQNVKASLQEFNGCRRLLRASRRPSKASLISRYMCWGQWRQGRSI